MVNLRIILKNHPCDDAHHTKYYIHKNKLIAEQFNKHTSQLAHITCQNKLFINL